jgi:hypothetical protein
MDDKTLARIYENLEEDRVESAVMGCLRVARTVKDYLNAAIFLRELYPSKTEVVRALYDDMSHLNKEAKKFLFEKSLERWIELHTLDFSFPSNDGEDDADEPEGERRTLFKVAAGELDAKRQQAERAIADMAVPSGMAPFDTAAFTDWLLHEKSFIRLQITAIDTVKARLKARCLNYAIEIERQVKLQRSGQGFVEDLQNRVNNFFKARSQNVYLKLQKAAQLGASREAEDFSLLLTEVRRALKAAADFFYPPVSGKVRCADGIERLLGDEQYLNRLQEFLSHRFARSTAKELMSAELDHLNAFLRRLNDMASKGVHAPVSLAESKQGLVGLYFFLSNLCRHLSQDGDLPSSGDESV